jgi:hypothetical protein
LTNILHGLDAGHFICILPIFPLFLFPLYT